MLRGSLLFAFIVLFKGFSYRLRPDQLPEEEAALLRAHSAPLFEQSFGSYLSFSSEIDHCFAAYDEALSSTYRLSASDQLRLLDLVGAYPWVCSMSFKEAYHHPDPEVEAFHKRALSSYGGWLEGRSYSNRSELAQDLEVIAHNIAVYGIESELNLFKSWAREDLRLKWMRIAASGPLVEQRGLIVSLFFLWLIVGTLLYLLPRYRLSPSPGIKHNGIYHDPMKTRGWIGWITGILLISFYILLYFYPTYIAPWVIMLDPASELLKGSPAGPFFLYGLLYTTAVVLMGLRMFTKYRHSTYHKVRTSSLIFFQVCFAFLLPEFLLRVNKPYFDFKNIWPLDYDFFFDTELNKLIEGGGLGLFMLGWGVALIIVGVPVFTYFFGKRWYCSWVCGCGGLAETLGDPYRQLSDKSLRAWKLERWSIHSVLILAILMTAAVLHTYWSGSEELLGINSFALRKSYGFYIGALFSGVIGTGFYPLMGSRVWCRFGCPLAAYLGLVQRLRSRFRITTNGGQCISCGNCSTYCEMGIDVRYYAQRGQDVVRASCVGCGVCASVCPRGVLRLENKSDSRSKIKLLGLEH